MLIGLKEVMKVKVLEFAWAGTHGAFPEPKNILRILFPEKVIKYIPAAPKTWSGNFELELTESEFIKLITTYQFDVMVRNLDDGTKFVVFDCKGGWFRGR